jgi:signal transduction histidine kinase
LERPNHQSVASPIASHGFLTRAAACLVTLTIGLSFGSVLLGWRLHRDAVELAGTELEIRSLAGHIMQYDEVLTMSARMAAASGKLEWEHRYREYDPLLAADLDRLIELAPEAFANAAATATAAANQALVALENRAFAAIHAGRRDAAVAILEGAEYRRLKVIYAAGMDQTNRAIVARAEDVLASQRTHLILLLVVAPTLWILIIGLSVLMRQALRRTGAAEARLHEANAILEQRVRERTAQLVASNDDLARQIQERMKVEIELRQVHKLESVGRLAAGVAHEINTPAQFANDSVHFVAEAFGDLARLIATYRKGEPAEELEDEINLAYLMDQVPPALQRSVDGLARIRDIVRAMKEFAYPEGGQMSHADLNRSILNTLTIARNEYKYVAELVTELGELPPVMCHVGEINQVVLNLVVNAAHAIADVVSPSSADRGRITVRTYVEGERVVVAVRDTGGGIPEAIRSRIFDPFFTTKDVGKGTGQGLAIAHSVIVAKHGGALWFDTEVGTGTTFYAAIPIDVTAVAAA